MQSVSLSSRANQLKPSPTLAMTARANAMRSAGEDVISLAAGEPDFATPTPICDAAVNALRQGMTKYSATVGLKPTREAIAAKLANDNGVNVSPDQIVITNGAKQALYGACVVLLDPGDEVILIAPYWATYADQVTLSGGTPVEVRTTGDTGFVPSVGQIAEKITSRTKMIILNSPCNPTGAVFPPAVIEGIADLACRHNLWVLSDEIYEKLIYGERHVAIASLNPTVAARTITIGGVSKTYAMTGWRVGYAAGPTPVIQAMTNLQDQITSNVNTFVQMGAKAAYDLKASEVEKMRAEFESRRDLICDLLSNIPHVSLQKPQGAFYVFPDMSAYIKGQIPDDWALAEFLLKQARVATVPGAAFSGPGHLRLSYAASPEQLRKGVDRLAQALATL